MRQIEAIRHDSNKYLLFSNGESFKAGYFYRNRRKVPYRWSTIARNLPAGSMDVIFETLFIDSVTVMRNNISLKD